VPPAVPIADDGQHDVLGGDSRGQLAVDLDQHVLRLLGQQGLRGQHVLDLAGADAVRQRAEGAVGGGVAESPQTTVMPGSVAPLLRADDVHDALALVRNGKYAAAPNSRMLASSVVTCSLADRVGDAVVAQLPAGGGRVVVGGGHDRTDAPDLAAGQAQALEGLRAGHFVHQVAVDVEHGGAVFFGVDDVFVPDLVVQGPRPLWIMRHMASSPVT
jgi:hypothetical protein